MLITGASLLSLSLMVTVAMAGLTVTLGVPGSTSSSPLKFSVSSRSTIPSITIVTDTGCVESPGWNVTDCLVTAVKSPGAVCVCVLEKKEGKGEKG